MTAVAFRAPRLANPLPRMAADAPAYTALGVFLALSMVVTLAASSIDARTFQGDDIWLKPIKFQIALVIYALSLAFFARWIAAPARASRALAVWSGLVAACVLGETVAIGGAAALGTASHFNVDTPTAARVYTLMGVMAVTLTAASLVTGVLVWRNRATGLRPALHLSVALGLVLTFVLTLPVAGYLSSNGGHFVGTPLPDAATLPILGWSRTVGDLRAPHLLATHAMHALPVAGLLAAAFLSDRAGVRAVWLAGAAYAGLVTATFAQALAGLPLV